MKHIVKEVVIDNHKLMFVRTDDETRVSLESDDPIVKEWIDTVHNRRVREKDIRFVIKAFTEAIESGNPSNYAKSLQQKKPDLTIVKDLNEWVQANFKTNPTWTFRVDNMIPTDPVAYATFKLPNGTVYEGEGRSKDWAKVEVATQVWADIDEGCYFDYEDGEDEDEE